MIRRTSKYLVASALVSFAAYSNAGTAVVSPALAACSKALIETIAKSETMPAYRVKAPSVFVSDLIDKNAFTVLAHNTKTKELLGKAACKATPEGEILSFKSIYVKS
jgi:hypothetical protein